MKKFVAVVLSAFMLCCGTNLSFAENDIPEVLQQTILSVKDRLHIPEEYSEFDYVINDYDDKEKYNLTWRKENKKEADSEKMGMRDDGEISVAVDVNGNIFSYNCWENNSEKSTIKDRKSREQCLNAATDFLKSVVGDSYSEFKFEKDLSDNNLFVFRQYKGDIPVRFNTANISVDNVSLKVLNFYFANADYIKRDFVNADGVIKSEEALKNFCDKVSLEPEYIFNYDYKTKEKKVFIAYRPKSVFYNKALDAKTGDLLECNMSNNGNYRSNSMKEETFDADAGGAASKLSEQELAKIEEAKELQGKEDADKEIKMFLPEGIDIGELRGAQLTKDRVDGKYIWNINYEKGNAAYDATNKKLKRFYSYKNEIIPLESDEVSEDFNGVTAENYDEVLNERKLKAEEYIKKVAPEKIDLIEFEENDSDCDRICFVRKVNGLSFPENAISIEFDNSGKIRAYDCEWYDSVEFPAAENLIPASDIVKKVQEKAGFGLIYEMGRKKGSQAEEFARRNDYKNKKDDVILSYSFIDLNSFAPFISAQTGKELNYDGTEYKGNLKAPESYPDIKGHWCEKYVNGLLNSGIYIKQPETDGFLPDNNITKNQLFESYDDFYDEDIMKVLKDKNESITRKELCKVISMFFGYEKITEKNIFKNPFKDIDDSDKDLGCMVAADALDIVSADDEGNFNPSGYITNAEAAKALYMLEELK